MDLLRITGLLIIVFALSIECRKKVNKGRRKHGMNAKHGSSKFNSQNHPLLRIKSASEYKELKKEYIQYLNEFRSHRQTAKHGQVSRKRYTNKIKNNNKKLVNKTLKMSKKQSKKRIEPKQQYTVKFRHIPLLDSKNERRKGEMKFANNKTKVNSTQTIKPIDRHNSFANISSNPINNTTLEQNGSKNAGDLTVIFKLVDSFERHLLQPQFRLAFQNLPNKPKRNFIETQAVVRDNTDKNFDLVFGPSKLINSREDNVGNLPDPNVKGIDILHDDLFTSHLVSTVNTRRSRIPTVKEREKEVNMIMNEIRTIMKTVHKSSNTDQFTDKELRTIKSKLKTIGHHIDLSRALVVSDMISDTRERLRTLESEKSGLSMKLTNNKTADSVTGEDSQQHDEKDEGSEKGQEGKSQEEEEVGSADSGASDTRERLGTLESEKSDLSKKLTNNKTADSVAGEDSQQHDEKDGGSEKGQEGKSQEEEEVGSADSGASDETRERLRTLENEKKGLSKKLTNTKTADSVAGEDSQQHDEKDERTENGQEGKSQEEEEVGSADSGPKRSRINDIKTVESDIYPMPHEDEVDDVGEDEEKENQGQDESDSTDGAKRSRINLKDIKAVETDIYPMPREFGDSDGSPKKRYLNKNNTDSSDPSKEKRDPYTILQEAFDIPNFEDINFNADSLETSEARRKFDSAQTLSGVESHSDDISSAIDSESKKSSNNATLPTTLEENKDKNVLKKQEINKNNETVKDGKNDSQATSTLKVKTLNRNKNKNSKTSEIKSNSTQDTGKTQDGNQSNSTLSTMRTPNKEPFEKMLSDKEQSGLQNSKLSTSAHITYHDTNTVTNQRDGRENFSTVRNQTGDIGVLPMKPTEPIQKQKTASWLTEELYLKPTSPIITKHSQIPTGKHHKKNYGAKQREPSVADVGRSTKEGLRKAKKKTKPAKAIFPNGKNSHQSYRGQQETSNTKHIHKTKFQANRKKKIESNNYEAIDKFIEMDKTPTSPNKRFEELGAQGQQFSSPTKPILLKFKHNRILTYKRNEHNFNQMPRYKSKDVAQLNAEAMSRLDEGKREKVMTDHSNSKTSNDSTVAAKKMDVSSSLENDDGRYGETWFGPRNELGLEGDQSKEQSTGQNLVDNPETKSTTIQTQQQLENKQNQNPAVARSQDSNLSTREVGNDAAASRINSETGQNSNDAEPNSAEAGQNDSENEHKSSESDGDKELNEGSFAQNDGEKGQTDGDVASYDGDSAANEEDSAPNNGDSAPNDGENVLNKGDNETNDSNKIEEADDNNKVVDTNDSQNERSEKQNEEQFMERESEENADKANNSQAGNLFSDTENQPGE